MKIAIVAVGYNRPDSMCQLLQSVVDADYDGDNVDLIISIDHGEKQDQIVDVANSVIWEKGKKIIRAFPEKLGLRKHILSCGDLTLEYDAVVVLEDDLIVSRSYYNYVKNAIRFYDDEDAVAGISLYSYYANEFSFMPFSPAYNGFDTYLLQVAQSWGQCWTRKMWKKFRSWEFSDVSELPDGTYMPHRIFKWGNNSWKKNYMAYIALKNLYFVYPYHAYSTNRSEIGEHRNYSSNAFQVALCEKCNNWKFAPIEEAVRYDVFFERVGIDFSSLYGNKKVCLDLNGLRMEYNEADILISTSRKPYELVKEIGLEYRPIEQNCILNHEGKGIFVYDLKKKSKLPKFKSADNLRFAYDYLCATYRRSLYFGLYGIKKRLFCRKHRR